MFRGMLSLFLILVVGMAAAHAQGAGAVRRGHAYAEQNCAECHAVDKGDGFSPGPGAPAFQVLANTRGVSWIALTAWLQRSHETMPDFIIPPQHREDVIAYILSLKEGRVRR
jgi:mono/diheme cytochrome c family protein